MEFCKRCGGILVKEGNVYKCPKCGYTTKEKIKIETIEKVGEKKKIGVIKEKDTDVFPKVEAVCPKCGHREAYFWTAQTRASDEAETRFFKCTKCSYTWREYT